ncbi:hypothetical protein [Spartinivicinus poritis]|uniref:Uncharacterized protein n=1 Tax=Spartinivicinus poritis TaxID=2994640 RepID=A0ABT5UH51_9GAMM|nr:hypothetical protein [Spartinivicinus sp. A2-2]MDE1465723.1 hypothetical protein [Spartinivicinus sp. A2-2]
MQRNAEVLKEILIEDYGLTKEHAQAATITLVGLGATYFARNYFKRNQKHAGQTSSNHYQTASAYDNRVDFERSYGVNFSNRTEANAAWRVYKQSSRSKEELVIGRLDDTAAREKLGFRRLNDSDWTINVNDAWIQGGIDARKKFYLGSNIDFKNLRTDNPKYPTTVFFRELKQLRDAGYKKVGNYMVPPSK